MSSTLASSRVCRGMCRLKACVEACVEVCLVWHHPSPTSRCRGLCRGFCRGCVSRVCVARVRGSRVSRERGWATRGPEQAVYLPLDSGGYPFEWVSMTGDLRSPPQASRGQERHLHPPSSRQEDCHSGHAPDAAPMQLRCSMRRGVEGGRGSIRREGMIIGGVEGSKCLQGGSNRNGKLQGLGPRRGA